MSIKKPVLFFFSSSWSEALKSFQLFSTNFTLRLIYNKLYNYYRNTEKVNDTREGSKEEKCTNAWKNPPWTFLKSTTVSTEIKVTYITVIIKIVQLLQRDKY